MCLLCVEIAKGNMSAKEVAAAYLEQSENDDNHIYDVMAEIAKQYGQEGLNEVGEEISKEYERRDNK